MPMLEDFYRGGLLDSVFSSQERSGWPWTSPSSFLNNSSWVERELPRITIVTPSYNQAQFLEETMRSVLLQGYPNLEYMVLDGGSADRSPEIIAAYAPYLAYWRSEKDEGQSAAIREGFSRATGEILGWVNSDDLLLPGCLFNVAQYFTQHPETECIVGGTIVIDADGRVVRDHMGLPQITRGGKRTFKRLLLSDCGFYQPASFWRRDAYLDVGGLDPGFRFTMDYDLYLRFALRQPLEHLNKLLACFRFHAQSKTTQLRDVRYQESRVLWQRYNRDKISFLYRYLYNAYVRVKDRLDNLPFRLAVALGKAKLPYGYSGTNSKGLSQ